MSVPRRMGDIVCRLGWWWYALGLRVDIPVRYGQWHPMPQLQTVLMVRCVSISGFVCAVGISIYITARSLQKETGISVYMHFRTSSP